MRVIKGTDLLQTFANRNGTDSITSSPTNISHRSHVFKRFSLDNSAISMQFQRFASQLSTDHNADNERNVGKTSAKLNNSKVRIYIILFYN